MKFVMLLIVVSFGTLVNVDLATNYYSILNQPGALNTTYIITGVLKKYISIEITLSTLNPNLLLVSNQTSAIIDFDQAFKQGSTIDLISSYENRQTRYLIIEVLNDPIYVSTIDDRGRTDYDIKIIARDNFTCSNNCYDRGYCSEFGCECSNNFIGDDCRQTAYKIGEQEQEIILQQYAQFFYLDLYENSGQDITIEISTNDENDVQIYVLITQALIVPNKDQTFDKNMYIEFNVTKYDSKFINFVVPDDIQNQEKLVFTFYIPNNSKISNSSSLYISLNNEDNSFKTYIIVIVVVIPIVVLILIFIFTYRFIRRKQQQGGQEKVLKPIKLEIVKIKYGERCEHCESCEYENCEICELCKRCEQCPFCQKALRNSKNNSQNKIVKVICKHHFHKKCIKTMIEKPLQDCPICRECLFK